MPAACLRKVRQPKKLTRKVQRETYHWKPCTDIDATLLYSAPASRPSLAPQKVWHLDYKDLWFFWHAKCLELEMLHHCSLSLLTDLRPSANGLPTQVSCLPKITPIISWIFIVWERRVRADRLDRGVVFEGYILPIGRRESGPLRNNL